jgi:hypothetical protein
MCSVAPFRALNASPVQVAQYQQLLKMESTSATDDRVGRFIARSDSFL